MTFRFSKQEDIQQIKALCDKHNAATPTDGVCIVAEDEGKIVGIINAQVRTVIEPFICESSSISKRILWEKMMTFLSGQKVWLIPHGEKLTNEAVKEGFKVIDSNVTILHKEV